MDRKIDLLVAMDFDLPDLEGLDSIILQQVHATWLLPTGHPLAGAEKIAPQQLQGETLILTQEDPGGNTEELLRQYLNAPYLYIDDLFKTGRGPDGTVAPSAADLNLAFTLLSARYARQAPTILSSELSADALLRLDEAIGSRIVEMAGKNLCAVRNDKKRNYRLKGIREL